MLLLRIKNYLKLFEDISNILYIYNNSVTIKTFPTMMNELITSIMTKNPVSLKPDSTLAEVHDLFAANRIHHIPITDASGDLMGLITTYDLWKLNLPFENYKEMKVSEVMSTKLAKISTSDKVGTAAELFLDNRFHAIPVVENNKLLGIVTSFDVLKYCFKKEYDAPILYKEVLENGIPVKK